MTGVILRNGLHLSCGFGGSCLLVVSVNSLDVQTSGLCLFASTDS